MKSMKKKKSLPVTKRWQVVHASRNRLRQSDRNNRAHRCIIPPRHSSRLINGSGMMFLPPVTSRVSLAWRAWKKVTRVSRHRGLHREYDRAIGWSSLLPLLRRDFNNEDAGSFSDPRWLSLFHRGSDKTKFQYCLDSNENLSFTAEPYKDIQEELWLIPALLGNVEIPLGRKEYLLPRRRFVDDALHHASRAYRREKGHQRRTAYCLLDTHEQ